MKATLRAPEPVIDSQRGVNVSLMTTGTILTVQTTLATYHLRVTDPAKGLVEVNGADHRMNGILACLVCSFYGPHHSRRRIQRPNWVGYNMRMQLRFKNFLLVCDPTVSLRVEGDGWHYDVF